MSIAIAVDELPRKAERLLRAVWEEHKTIILEQNGEPVAEVVPLRNRQRRHLREADKAS